MTSPRTVQLRSWAAERRVTRARARSKSDARSTTSASSTEPRGHPRPRVADQRDRRQVLDARGEPAAGEPLADRPHPVAVLTARHAERAAQVLLVDDHVAERADVVRPHPVAEGLGDRLPLRHQRGDVVAAPGLHLTARPRLVVVVRLVACDHVHPQPDHVREQVAHGPVRAGRHPQVRPLRRQVRHQLDHPLLGPAPLLDCVHGHSQPPRARPRRTRAPARAVTVAHRRAVTQPVVLSQLPSGVCRSYLLCDDQGGV